MCIEEVKCADCHRLWPVKTLYERMEKTGAYCCPVCGCAVLYVRHRPAEVEPAPPAMVRVDTPDGKGGYIVPEELAPLAREALGRDIKPDEPYHTSGGT